MMLVVSSVGSLEEARTIAKHLVTTRLVACAQILPAVEALYWWKDEVVLDSEVVLLCKTTQDRTEEAISEIVKLHSYELPEVIAFSVDSGFSAYLDYIGEETQ